MADDGSCFDWKVMHHWRWNICCFTKDEWDKWQKLQPLVVSEDDVEDLEKYDVEETIDEICNIIKYAKANVLREKIHE